MPEPYSPRQLLAKKFSSACPNSSDRLLHRSDLPSDSRGTLSALQRAWRIRVVVLSDREEGGAVLPASAESFCESPLTH